MPVPILGFGLGVGSVMGLEGRDWEGSKVGTGTGTGGRSVVAETWRRER